MKFYRLSLLLDKIIILVYNIITTYLLYNYFELEYNMKIYTYENANGKDLIRKYINKLSRDEQIDAYSVLQAFEEDRINELNTKVWQGKIWEAYFYKHNRIFYIVVENQKVYLLHACRKQKNKTEARDKNIVIKRAKELENELNKKFL